MTKLGHLPEFEKPTAPRPIVTKLEQIDQSALAELVGYLSAIPAGTFATSVAGLADAPSAPTGGVSTQTLGTVISTLIPHGLAAAPRAFTAQPANNNAAAAAPTYYLEADDTNIIISFSSALTTPGEYAWVWTAIP